MLDSAWIWRGCTSGAFLFTTRKRRRADGALAHLAQVVSSPSRRRFRRQLLLAPTPASFARFLILRRQAALAYRPSSSDGLARGPRRADTAWTMPTHLAPPNEKA